MVKSFNTRSLHDVPEVVSQRTGYLCLSVRMFQLQNRWTDSDAFRHGHYAIESYPNLVILISYNR
jgi:hypothetical protein